MAGSLAVVETDLQQNEMPLNTIKVRDQWQVLFARFINSPSLSSTCSNLLPLRYCAAGGKWIATSLPVASLQIITPQSSSDAILAVSLSGKILEEHYISNLHFSWPQVQCPEFPARGSRAVFVSYKEKLKPIQKFALRFSTLHETESFMISLREKLRSDNEPLNNNFGSEFSEQSEFICNYELPSRACQELSDITATGSYTPEMPSYSYESEQQSFNQEANLNHNVESILPALPPSFTSLMIDCCSNTIPDVAANKPTVSEETDLKSQIVRFMEDPSFRDMLDKVEKIVSELEGI